MQRRIVFILAVLSAFCIFGRSAEAHGYRHFHHRHAHHRHFHFRTHSWHGFMRRGWFHSGHHGWHHHRRRFEHHRLRFGHGGRHAWHLAPQHAVRQARSFGGESGGLASWYSGRRTANGELFSGSAFTAAHRFYPFGTRVRVTCQSTGRSVVVRINDRGPFIKGRVIDLSRSAALAVGISGIGRVSLRRL